MRFKKYFLKIIASILITNFSGVSQARHQIQKENFFKQIAPRPN